MESLVIERTAKSPSINLSDGMIEIKGRSIPENPKKLYKPAFDWVKKYINSPAEYTRVNFNFEYIDTSSSKWILDIIRLLDQIEPDNNIVKLNWHYEVGDYDMFDLGMHLKSFVNIPFDFIEVEESIDDE
jgi:hypothetical protein